MNFLSELDESERDVFQMYKQALLHIGVDFTREDVGEAIIHCAFNMENAFRATIVYWLTGKMQYPNAFLITALNEGWKPYRWHDEWLSRPEFKNSCLRWWDAAEAGLEGQRNQLIADVRDEHGVETVFFTNGKTMTLSTAQRIGWKRVLAYGREQGIIN